MKELTISCFPFLFYLHLNECLQIVSLSFKLNLELDNTALKRQDFDHSEELRRFSRVFLAEMKAYFSRKSSFLDLPHVLKPSGFSQKVLSELRSVPAGEVITYHELAKRLGVPRGARAVGQALSRNPLPLIYPCHRVISRSGLGGYSQGKLLKYLLLLIERGLYSDKLMSKF